MAVNEGPDLDCVRAAIMQRVARPTATMKVFRSMRASLACRGLGANLGSDVGSRFDPPPFRGLHIHVVVISAVGNAARLAILADIGGDQIGPSGGAVR